MLLIGVDYHPSFQTIAFFDEETGECGEQELNHSDGQAEKFWRWPAHSARLRADHRNSGAVPLRQADRHVGGDDSE